MTVKFPANNGQRYYPLHFQYMLGIFGILGWPVEFFNDNTGERGCFRMFLDGVEFMVDFSDYGHEYDGDLPCLRFHYKPEHAKKNVFPFAPGSFWNWATYEVLCRELTYKAEGLVMHNQWPHLTNYDRRHHVRRLVEDWCDRKKDAGVVLPKGISITGRELNGADTQYHGAQTKYWRSLKDCLVSIHVPGQNNNMLDSAQLQLMGFGFCTISPNLPEILPFDVRLEPDTHYIRCAADYSDLKDKIDWCVAHKECCVLIGKMAKRLFEKTCMPWALGAWMQRIVGELQ